MTITDDPMVALLAEREARDRWATECAGLGVVKENDDWFASLTDGDRAALDEYEEDVKARLQELMVAADTQPLAAARKAQQGH